MKGDCDTVSRATPIQGILSQGLIFLQCLPLALFCHYGAQWWKRRWPSQDQVYWEVLTLGF